MSLWGEKKSYVKEYLDFRDYISNKLYTYHLKGKEKLAHADVEIKTVPCQQMFLNTDSEF